MFNYGREGNLKHYHQVGLTCLLMEDLHYIYRKRYLYDFMCICLEYCVIFQNWSIYVKNITSNIYVEVIVQSL